MAAERIGRVKSGKGSSYEVKWDSHSGEVYVDVYGYRRAGRARSAGEAMRIAEAYVYNK